MTFLLALALPLSAAGSELWHWFHHGPPLPPNDYSHWHYNLPEKYYIRAWHRPLMYTSPAVPFPYAPQPIIMAPVLETSPNASQQPQP